MSGFVKKVESSSSGRRGGGKVRIPRCLRDLQAGWESRVFDFSTPRLCHGLDLFFCRRRQQLSFRAVLSDAVSCDGEGQCLIQVLVDDDLASGHGGAPFGTLNLHDQVVKAHRVIPIDGALESLRKDHFQIPVPAGYKRRAALRGRNRKSAVELSDVVIVEKVIGRRNPLIRGSSGICSGHLICIGKVRCGGSHLVDHWPIGAVLRTRWVSLAVPPRSGHLGYQLVGQAGVPVARLFLSGQKRHEFRVLSLRASVISFAVKPEKLRHGGATCIRT